MTEATVQSATVRVIPKESSGRFRADLGYCYVVNGSFYSGYVERRFKEEAKAREYCRNAVGTKFSVRYDPERFELSTPSG